MHHHLLSFNRLISSICIFFFGWSSAFSQDSKYVSSVGLGIEITKSTEYYYTQSVTLQENFAFNSEGGKTLLIKPIAVNPPPSNAGGYNYVREEVPFEEVTTERELTNMTADQKSVAFQYVDGVGRPMMTSSPEAGSSYEDIVQYYEYNETTGRQDRSYLRYTKKYSEPGSFVENADVHLKDFYTTGASDVATDEVYYTENAAYDARGMVVESKGLGEAWSSKSTQYDYGAYSTSDGYKVQHWKVVGDKPQMDRYYINNELQVSSVTNVESKTTHTLKDMRGLGITSLVYDDDTDQWMGSYQVYDDMGRLRFVIPPMIAASLNSKTSSQLPHTPSDVEMQELVFQYKYDEKGRLASEKAPGAGWIEYVYDEWDRLVMSRYEGQQYEGAASWTFQKYDALNRPIVSGEVKTSKTRAELITAMNAANKGRFETTSDGTHGYTLTQSFPDLNSSAFYDYAIMTVNYNDDYDFIERLGLGTAYNYSKPSGFSHAKDNRTKGLSTGSKVRVLGTGVQWLYTVMYYDDEGRAIQVVGDNHLGGKDIFSSELDWSGQVQKTLVEHSSTAGSLTKLNEFEYDDHSGQLLRTYETISHGSYSERVLIAEYHYNSMGQIVEKNLHSTDNGNSFLQAVNYDFNIRGWTSQINDPANLNGDVFGMKFNYTTGATIADAAVAGRHDGMLSSLQWNADTDPTQSGVQGYKQTALGFEYDDRNRLKGTRYATLSGSDWSGDKGEYNTTIGLYDENGNIKQLTRQSEAGAIDDLAYTYYPLSNKLQKVDDAERGTERGKKGLHDQYTGATDYTYNAQGNMTGDANKGLDITYNHLQLVSTISMANVIMEYTYDAVGNKLSKEVLNADGNSIARVDYVGGIELLDGEVNQIFNAEGRAYRQNGDYHYEYFLLDHQQNNRVAFGNLPERKVYTVTMESGRESYEESAFANIAAVRLSSEQHNHTPLGAATMQLNGTVSGRQVGAAKVLDIQAGDEVAMEVWAKYEDSFHATQAIAGIGSIVENTFATASAGTGAESAAGALSTAIGNPAAYDLFSGDGWHEPKAYLQYLFFDSDYQFDSGQSGYIPVTTSSKGQFAKLAETATFSADGYLFVYLVNETNLDAEVYFDDLKLTHASSTQSFRVTQVNDFYPFGLATSNSWRAPGYVDPGLLYQSSYANYDSLTGYYDFLSRSYDPALGRFFAVDPMTHKYPNWSPYMGMANSPHMVVDPNGEEPITLAVLAVAALKGAVIGAATSTAIRTGVGIATGNWDNFGQAVAMGAIGGFVGGGIAGAFKGSAFAQTAGFSILKNTSSTIAGNVIMGHDITGGTIVGSVAGGLVGSKLPQFSGVEGSSLANIGAEIAHEATTGAIRGAVTGGVSAAVDGRDIERGIVNGAKYGAIGGAAVGVFNIATMGPAFKPEEDYSPGVDKRYKPVYRKGTFITRALAGEGSGVTLGRNIVTHLYKNHRPINGAFHDKDQLNRFLLAHETGHYYNQIQDGFSNFYYKVGRQYLRFGWSTSIPVEAYAEGYAEYHVGPEVIWRYR